MRSKMPANNGNLRWIVSFRIEKRFANRKPTLHVEDLGDANALLQRSSYFHKEADLLLRQGVHEVQPVWRGWLGQYQTKLQAELRNSDGRKREKSGRGGRSVEKCRI